MLPKNGEVWKVDYNGVERMVVVVAAHDGYCTVLLLNDRPKSDNDIGLAIGDIEFANGNNMFTDPGKLAYRYTDVFTERVMWLPNDEFSYLMGAVADALFIKADDLTDKAEEYEKQLANCMAECKALSRERAELKAELAKFQQPVDVGMDMTHLKCANAGLKAERDVYKSLYTETLAKLIDGR